MELASVTGPGESPTSSGPTHVVLGDIAATAPPHPPALGEHPSQSARPSGRQRDHWRAGIQLTDLID
jgi:hypothetical protein